VFFSKKFRTIGLLNKGVKQEDVEMEA